MWKQVVALGYYVGVFSFLFSFFLFFYFLNIFTIVHIADSTGQVFFSEKNLKAK